MTIQVDIKHVNKGYPRKIRVTQFNQHHETGQWIPVHSAIVSDGESITKYVHTTGRVLIEEQQPGEEKE